jgi:DNA invertase Pin-like site-specific DNA recombinase
VVRAWLNAPAIPHYQPAITVRSKQLSKAYAYRRVSTVDQASTGFSLSSQKDSSKAYYVALTSATDKYPGLEWGGFYKDEGKSAWKHDFASRKEGGKLCELLNPGDHIIFCRLDRAFRNLKDYVLQMEKWNSRGIVVHFVDQWINMDTANGRLLGNVLSAVAQWESDIKSERIKEGIARRRGENRPMNGSTPPGMQKIGPASDARFAPDPSQRPILRLIRIYRNSGMSYDRISDRLEDLLASREGRKPVPRTHFTMKRDWSADKIRHTAKRLDKLIPNVPPSERAAMLNGDDE